MKSKPTPMENTTSPQFINGAEAQQFFADQTNFNLEKYSTLTRLKAWTGAYFGVYEYRVGILNPVLVDKLKLVHMEVRMTGPSALLVSMITGSVCEVSCVPKHLLGYGVGVSFAQRSYFEKTIKVYGPDDYMAGLASCIQIHHKQRPDHNSTGIQFVALWNNFKKLFVDEDSFIRETERLKTRISLV